jgi:O-antigen/teichoic acid export membrane protein
VRWLEALLGRDVAHGAFVGSLWTLARLLLQAVYLILTARILSAAGYGEFAAVVSLAAILAPLAGLGSGMVMLKHVSREPEALGAFWAVSLRLTTLSSLAFAAFLVVFSAAVLPQVEWRLVAAVVAAEILAVPFIATAALAFQAVGQFGAANLVGTLPAAVRVAGACLVLAWLPQPSPAVFALVHLTATALCAAAALVMVEQRLRPARVPISLRERWRDGFPYAASGVVGVVGSEIDKPLLLRLAGAEAAGVFAAAFRLASAAAAPVSALVLAAAPALFREAQAPPTRALRVLAVALGYAAIAAAALAGLSWVAPLLLGAAFAESAVLLQWLAPWLVFSTARQIGCAALTTRGQQGVRVALETAGAAASVVLNLALIPVLGAFGAALALTLTDATLAAAAWLFVLAHRPALRQGGSGNI